jgi:hypothetical protein
MWQNYDVELMGIAKIDRKHAEGVKILILKNEKLILNHKLTQKFIIHLKFIFISLISFVQNKWPMIGVQQSHGWVHYASHRHEPHSTLFKSSRPLNR